MINKLLGIHPNAAANGMLIDDMIEFCHWFMLILFVGWSCFFLYTLWRFRRRRNPKADYYGAQGGISTHLEFSVVLVEAVIFFGFALTLWNMHVNLFPRPENAVTVRAIGEQFLWNFHYPGPDGVFGETHPKYTTSANPVGLDMADPAAQDDIVVKNEMHLPVDQPAIIQIYAKDVIHNFALPAMRVAQDAIPGMMVPIWFQPSKTSPVDEYGIPMPYEIICGQLCGSGHGVMRAVLAVDTAEDYDAWVKSKVPQPATTPETPTTEAEVSEQAAVTPPAVPQG